ATTRSCRPSSSSVPPSPATRTCVSCSPTTAGTAGSWRPPALTRATATGPSPPSSDGRGRTSARQLRHQLRRELGSLPLVLVLEVGVRVAPGRAFVAAYDLGPPRDVGIAVPLVAQPQVAVVRRRDDGRVAGVAVGDAHRDVALAQARIHYVAPPRHVAELTGGTIARRQVRKERL